MPQALTYPGVYIEEKPSGVHTIVGVGTSITAFVGSTAAGVENTAVQLFNWRDYTRSFGPLASDSELSYGVQQFFANGGRQCVVVRVPKHGAVAGKLVLAANKNTSNKALNVSAISSGSWSNSLVVDVDYDNIAPPRSAFPGTFKLAPATPPSKADKIELDAAAAAAIRQLSTGQWVSFGADLSGTLYQIETITPAVPAAGANAAQAANITLSTPYSGPSSPASSLMVLDAAAFNLTITETVSGQSENFPNVSMHANAANFVDTIVNNSENGSKYVRAAAQGADPPQITGFVSTLPGDATLGLNPGMTGLAEWLRGPRQFPNVAVANGSIDVNGTGFLNGLKSGQTVFFRF